MCYRRRTTVTVENFTLFKEKLTLKAHTINVIPCMFQTLKPLNPLRFQLEWGKMDTKGYTPLIHLHGDRVTVASPDLKDKYHIFESQVANGICSLVINPTEMTDSGTYQVRLKIVGKLYEPVPSIDIQVENQDTDSRGLSDKKSETTTIASTAAATVSFEDEILQYINSSAKRETTTSIVLGMLLVVGVIGLLIAVQQCMNRRPKNPAGDEENPSSDEETPSSDEETPSSDEKKPPVKTSKKGKDKKEKKKKREKSESEKSSDESEESASSKSEESESD
ncbi:uncharacterized protein LOC108705811 isoform X2 [Xenopus laevis]|uniref:Uncharacterized protein LOC108705811 isoform X2 n=1 Tax=Xenopus laevis TaxID=8355 RepID=A0A8J1LLM1_XENLA|nr:uncharacterized protein LOC108705811 isoform X2 [Xenopus laevis]